MALVGGLDKPQPALAFGWMVLSVAICAVLVVRAFSVGVYVDSSRGIRVVNPWRTQSLRCADVIRVSARRVFLDNVAVELHTIGGRKVLAVGVPAVRIDELRDLLKTQHVP